MPLLEAVVALEQEKSPMGRWISQGWAQQRASDGWGRACHACKLCDGRRRRRWGRRALNGLEYSWGPSAAWAELQPKGKQNPPLAGSKMGNCPFGQWKCPLQSQPCHRATHIRAPAGRISDTSSPLTFRCHQEVTQHSSAGKTQLQCCGITQLLK